jgi:uncharacterized protein (DUF362 family)
MTNQNIVQRYEILESSAVGISTGHVGYSSESPYSPGTTYPEYPFDSNTIEENVNHAYEGVRNALHLLQLDEENYGQKNWNPLGQIIHPGETVVLKPNWIRDFRETQTGHGDCLITHGSIIRATLDYVYIALKGNGRIIIADAPQEDANFDAIQRISEMNKIQEFYRRYSNLEVEVYDLRPEKTRTVDGVTIGYDQLPGDPNGYVKVDLGQNSMFAQIEHLCHLVYGSDYDTSEIRRHHTGGVHEYLISRTIMEADCIINLPKLKTHKKTGLTICMKNLVGINGNKNWLPHHRLGTPSQGGDQFADNGLKHKIERRTMACFRGLFPLLGPLRSSLAKPLKVIGQSIFGNTNTDTIRSGNWYGNDTTWRMVLDLNRIITYADKNGYLQENPTRRIFFIVDGIIGGEGNGPLDPVSKSSGIVVSGMNPVAVDLACARIIGFDYNRIPLLSQALDNNHPMHLAAFGYDEVTCRLNTQEFGCPLNQFDELIIPFKPHFGWQGHVESKSSEISKA